jgi:hypothetical protein
VIGRFVASLASNPSDAAWNCPRQRISGMNPDGPGSNVGADVESERVGNGSAGVTGPVGGPS